MDRRRRVIATGVSAALLAVGAAAPTGAAAAASENASCVGQFASGAPAGPEKGEFASTAAKAFHPFGRNVVREFARAEVCPF